MTMDFIGLGLLESGVYIITVEKEGFSTNENRNLAVNTATEVTYNTQLKTGEVSIVVDDPAADQAVTLNKTNDTIGTRIESRRAVELPLGVARNVNSLALLSPNVFSAPGSAVFPLTDNALVITILPLTVRTTTISR